jgi:hypothetical protein
MDISARWKAHAYIHTYKHTYMHYIHTYTNTHISFRRSKILSYIWTRNLSGKTHNTQAKQTNTIQYNKQMSVLQSPKSNPVHNIIIIIIKYNTNYNRNNLSN